MGRNAGASEGLLLEQIGVESFFGPCGPCRPHSRRPHLSWMGNALSKGPDGQRAPTAAEASAHCWRRDHAARGELGTAGCRCCARKPANTAARHPQLWPTRAQGHGRARLHWECCCCRHTSQMLRGQSGLVFWSAWSQLKVRGRAGATAEQTICSSQGSTRPGLDAARAGNGTPPTRFPHTSLHLTLGGRSQGLSLCRVSDRFCSLLCLCWWQPSLWQPAWPTRLPPRLATRCQQSMAGT
jgi:hypothetical protein